MLSLSIRAVSVALFATGVSHAAVAHGQTAPSADSQRSPAPGTPDVSQPTAQTTEPSGTPAAAAEPTEGLADIVVTAQRRAENLQNVPIAITALTSESLTKSGVTDIQSLQVAAPSLNFAQATGYSLPRVRGVGTGATGPGVENSVAMYVDGVYVAATSAGLLSFNNIAQVAVLKGPQGTLFGRNATGGVIQITTLDPGQTTTVNASATYGNHNTYGGNLYLAGPLTTDLAADVAVYYNNLSDGYARNVTNGDKLGRFEEVAVRSKVKWEPTDSTTVRLVGDYSQGKGVRPIIQNVAGSLPISRVPPPPGKFDASLTFDPSQTSKQGGASLQIDQKVGDLSLVSITAYRKASLRLRFDADGQAVPLTDVYFLQKDKQFSQEIQLLSPKSGRFTWMIGGYYFNATGRFSPSQATTKAPPYLAPPTIITTRTKQTTESLAAFGQATYEIFDATNFTAGLRYTTDKREIDIPRTIKLPNGVVLNQAGAGDARFNKLTWRFALDHRFSSALLGYVSYNRGFKSGLFDPNAIPVFKVKPEVLDAYEAGVKADLFDRMLRINAAYYHYDYSNVQVLRVTNGVTQLLSGPAAKIDGVDVDATAQLGRHLTINAGLSVIDSRFTSYPNAVITTPLPTGGNALSTGDVKGNRLPMTPDWSSNLAATYTVESGVGNFALNATYLHNDGYYEGPENRIRQKPFDLVNGSLAWTSPSGRWSASLWGKNIFNKFYATQFSAQATQDGDIYGLPRTYGVTVGLKY